MSTQTQIYKQTHTQTHTSTDTHTHTQDAHAHILTHARIHIRKHTQTRTHTRTKNRARLILTPCFLNIRRYGHYGYGCVQETSLHALRQTQSTLQQNGTLAELQTEHLSPPLINQMPRVSRSSFYDHTGPLNEHRPCIW